MDLEAEQAVVTLLLGRRKDPAFVDEALRRLPDETFQDLGLQKVWRLLRATWEKHQDLSLARIEATAREMGMETPDQVLTARSHPLAYSLEDWDALVDRLLTLNLRRRIFRAGRELQDLAEQEQDVRAVQAQAQQLVLKAVSEMPGAGPEIIPISQVYSRLSEALERRRRGEEAESVTVGIGQLDDATGGFQPGELVVLAARPNMGKTALAIAMAAWVARRRRPVLFFSLEQSDLQIAARLAAREGSIPHEEFRRRMSDQAWTAYLNTVKKVSEWPLYLCGLPSPTAAELESLCRQFRAEHGDLALVVIDQLQYVAPPRQLAKAELRIQLAQATRDIKALAQRVGAPVVLLHQVGRVVTTRDNKRPTMHDLKESGHIEEVADWVLLLHRFSYYEPAKAEELGVQNVAEIIIGKAREGRTGICLAEFQPEYLRFQSLSPELTQRYLDTVLADKAAPSQKERLRKAAGAEDYDDESPF